jgi:hypothetical protein
VSTPEKHVLYAFSLPIKADKVPAGPDWLHEVKYDGYRMMLIREQGRVRAGAFRDRRRDGRARPRRRL